MQLEGEWTLAVFVFAQALISVALQAREALKHPSMSSTSQSDEQIGSVIKDLRPSLRAIFRPDVEDSPANAAPIARTPSEGSPLSIDAESLAPSSHTLLRQDRHWLAYTVASVLVAHLYHSGRLSRDQSALAQAWFPVVFGISIDSVTRLNLGMFHRMPIN